MSHIQPIIIDMNPRRPPVAPRLRKIRTVFVALFLMVAVAYLGGHVLAALYPAIP